MSKVKPMTIHYISDFRAINELNHLLNHIKYITRASSLPITNIPPDYPKIWKERFQFEKSIRKDAQLAITFNMALPNDRINDTNFFEDVVTFITEFFNLAPNTISYAVHRNDPNNIHIHIVMYPRTKEGKKLRTRGTLSQFHMSWRKFLELYGYSIKQDDIKLDHIGYKRPKDLQKYYELQNLKEILKNLK